jgi:hypothetical protein
MKRKTMTNSNTIYRRFFATRHRNKHHTSIYIDLSEIRRPNNVIQLFSVYVQKQERDIFLKINLYL